MQQESIFLNQSHHQLHIRHIWTAKADQPVLMLHGAIENGKIFYSEKGKGLGCYLAEQGYDVYVADFRGRGDSTPSIFKDNKHGYYELTVEDIPALVDMVYQRTGKRLHVICHSWGGVLFTSALVRFSTLREKVLSNVCFGTKRQVTVWNIERVLKVSLFWNRIAPQMVKKAGYLDAKRYRVGADAETRDSLMQSVSWVKKSRWVDPVDHFDYEAAAKSIDWPPVWHLTGCKDKALGHAKDVQLFIKETHNPKAKFSNLSKRRGALMNYDHINILTHPLARKDHFPKVVDWLKAQEN